MSLAVSATCAAGTHLANGPTMMQRFTTLLLLAIAPILLMAAACTHQHARPAFARELAESNKVTLEDGTVLEPQDLQYTHEGTMVLTTDGRRDVLHPGQVRTVESVNRVRGMLQGFGIGALVGAGTGVVVGLSDGDDPEDTFIAFSATDKAILFGSFLGMLGGVGGAAVGFIAGSRDVYNYEATGAPRISVVPTTGGAQASLSLSF